MAGSEMEQLLGKVKWRTGRDGHAANVPSTLLVFKTNMYDSGSYGAAEARDEGSVSVCDGAQGCTRVQPPHQQQLCTQ